MEKMPKPPLRTEHDTDSSRLPKADGFHWQRWRGGLMIESGDLIDGVARHERIGTYRGKPVDDALSEDDAEKIGRYLMGVAKGDSCATDGHYDPDNTGLCILCCAVLGEDVAQTQK